MRTEVTSSGPGTNWVTVSTPGLNVADVSEFLSDESRPTKVGTLETLDCVPTFGPATVTLYVNGAVTSWALANPGFPRKTDRAVKLPVPSPLNVRTPRVLNVRTKVGPSGTRSALNPGGGVYDVGVMIAAEMTQTALPLNAKSPFSL